MKQLNKTTIGLAFVFISTIFISCESYDDEAPRIDNNSSYFYFTVTEMTSTERAEYEAIKKEYREYKDQIESETKPEN